MALTVVIEFYTLKNVLTQSKKYQKHPSLLRVPKLNRPRLAIFYCFNTSFTVICLSFLLEFLDVKFLSSIGFSVQKTKI